VAETWIKSRPALGVLVKAKEMLGAVSLLVAGSWDFVQAAPVASRTGNNEMNIQDLR
jgi:hypothetical protein